MEQTSCAKAGYTEDDERLFKRLKSKSAHAELPGIDTAMWPGDVQLQLDVSEYNDRYIRMPFPTQLMYFFYVVSCWNTAGFIFLIIVPLWNGVLDIEYVVYFFLNNMPVIAIAAVSYPSLRYDPDLIFNRQAQVIHRMCKGQVIHIPWRSVRPFTKFNLSRQLEFYSPLPPIVRNNPRQPFAKYFLRQRFPLNAGTCRLDPLDKADVEMNLQRLEFLRRYMEHGVSAIQPPPDITPKKVIYNDMKRARAEGLTFYRLFMECVYWFALGPLVDLWVKWLRSKAVWPEEVKRLLEPGADLSEFDTTPVHPHPNVYYRYDMPGYHLCDENGHEIPW